MHLEKPLVSVIVPAYNAASFVERAVYSALNQDYEFLEIVVIDDGSEDDTAEIVSSIIDKRIKLIKLGKNSGECAAMNRGMEHAKGAYIAFLDADDEWQPNKITVQVKEILQNDNCAFVTCNDTEIYPDGRVVVNDWNIIDSNDFEGSGRKNMVVVDQDVLVKGRHAWKTLLFKTFVSKPTVLARASSIEKVGGFNETLKVAGDQDMWIRLALTGEVGCVPENLVIVHKNPGSLMNRHPVGEFEYLLPMIKTHVDRNRLALRRNEVRTIMGRRYQNAGIVLCENRRRWKGIGYLARSLFGGGGVTMNIRLILTYIVPTFLLQGIRRYKSTGRVPG